MKIIGEIQLKRNNTLGGDGLALPPLPSELEVGEIVLNYNANNPAIFFKNDNNQIVKIVSEEVIADTLAEILGASPNDLSSLKELLDKFADSDIATTQATILVDLQNLKSGKVDKKTGYGLSQNNYSTPEKTKLAGIEDGAQVNTIIADVTASAEDWEGVSVDSTLSATSKNPIANNAVATEFNKLTKHMILTELEYEAIVNKDSNTIYYITE